MQLPPTIRAAKAEDIPTLAGFQVSMAQETEGKTLQPESVARAMARVLQESVLGRYLVAERDGDIVASLMVTYEWSDWREAMWWWIQSVYVVPAARRTGLYRALYAEVQSQAQQAGDVCGIRLYVEHENSRAQQTYADLGMRRCHYHMYEAEFPG